MDWFSWENLNTGNHQFPMKIMVFSISVAICQLINSDVFFWFRGSHQHQLLYTESDLHFHFMLYVETQCVTIRTNPVTQYFSIDTMRTACSILRANFLKIFPPVWWFQTFFYFPFHIWVVILPLTNSYFSTWLKHVKTTNQPSFFLVFSSLRWICPCRVGKDPRAADRGVAQECRAAAQPDPEELAGLVVGFGLKKKVVEPPKIIKHFF